MIKAKTNRRGFLGFMAASPIAAKNLADEAIAKATGINLPGVAIPSAENASKGSKPYHRKLKNGDVRKILNLDKSLRSSYESSIYARNRDICQVDPDIAVHKSMSFMAKVTYQRQRVVDKAMADALKGEDIYAHSTRLLKKALGLWKKEDEDDDEDFYG